MPTTYAHYRFGQDVLERLPAERRQMLLAHRPLFDFGVHGPDLLFYYRPMAKNHVNRKGSSDHNRTGRDFFTEAIGVTAAAGDRDAAWTYLCGVLCHFALDRTCHPYVGEKELDGVSHSAIEASFDRYLMEKDGLDSLTHDVTAHLHPSRATAKVIAPFYDGVSEEETYQAEKSMVFYLKALIATGPKRAALLGLMRLVRASRLGDLFVPYEQNPACIDSDRQLYQLYLEAVPLGAELIDQAANLLEGRGELGIGFDHTFSVD